MTESYVVDALNETKLHVGALAMALVEKGLLTDADMARIQEVHIPTLRARQDQLKAELEAKARAESPLYALMSNMMRKIEEGQP